MLEKLFDKILNIKITTYNQQTDILDMGASPEDVVYLLVNINKIWGVDIDRFIGDFPITYNLLVKQINEKSCIN